MGRRRARRRKPSPASPETGPDMTAGSRWARPDRRVRPRRACLFPCRSCRLRPI